MQSLQKECCNMEIFEIYNITITNKFQELEKYRILKIFQLFKN